MLQSLPVLSLIRRTSLISVCLIIQFILRMWIIGFEPPIFTAADNPASFHPNRLIRVMWYIFLILCWNEFNLDEKRCLVYQLQLFVRVEFMDINQPVDIMFWLFNGLRWSDRKSFRLSCTICYFVLDCCYWFVRSLLPVQPKLQFSVKCFLKMHASNIVAYSYCNFSYCRCILLALIWTITTFLPAANVFFRVGFVLAERVLYLPSVGFCLLTALAFDRLRRTVGSKGQLVRSDSFFKLAIITFVSASIYSGCCKFWVYHVNNGIQFKIYAS